MRAQLADARTLGIPARHTREPGTPVYQPFDVSPLEFNEAAHAQERRA